MGQAVLRKIKLEVCLPQTLQGHRGLVAWRVLEGLRTMKLYTEVSLHMQILLTMGEGSSLLLRTDPRLSFCSLLLQWILCYLT